MENEENKIRFECLSAKENHIPGILNVLEKVGLDSDLNENVLKKMMLISNDLMIVAVMESNVIGVIISSYNGVSVWSSHMAVLPQYQKLGIASNLQTESERRAIRLDARRIVVDSWIDSAPFYRKKGFRLPGCIFMLKDLNNNFRHRND